MLFLLKFASDMNRSIILALCALLAAAPFNAIAGDNEPVKTGWSINPMPDVGYNSDTGLNLGAFADLFYYGDGSVYPNFLQRASLAACWMSKGGWYAHGSYEAKDIMDDIDVSMALSYVEHSNNPFYGFNGIASPYNKEMDFEGGQDLAFYSNQKKMFRAAGNLQGRITDDFRWIGGFTYRYFNYDDMSLEGCDPDNTLFGLYKDIGLIRSDEAEGGSNLEVMAGLLYDTRDITTSPKKGIYANVMMLANKDLHNNYDFAKLVAHISLFVPASSWCTLACHVAYQGLIAGEQPFYMLQDFATLFYKDPEFDGLGSRYTFRGSLYSRLLGDGYVWANIEPRISVARFRVLGQGIEVIVNPFVDLGIITDKYRLDEQKFRGNSLVYSTEEDGLHTALGIGGKLHVNQNFILSLDFGKAVEDQIAPSPTLSLATAYVF